MGKFLEAFGSLLNIWPPPKKRRMPDIETPSSTQWKMFCDHPSHNDERGCKNPGCWKFARKKL